MPSAPARLKHSSDSITVSRSSASRFESPLCASQPAVTLGMHTSELAAHAHAAHDIQVRYARFNHHHVRTFVKVHSDFVNGFITVSWIHLVVLGYHLQVRCTADSIIAYVASTRISQSTPWFEWMWPASSNVLHESLPIRRHPSCPMGQTTCRHLSLQRETVPFRLISTSVVLHHSSRSHLHHQDGFFIWPCVVNGSSATPW